jgi:hypothetical protein
MIRVSLDPGDTAVRAQSHRVSTGSRVGTATHAQRSFDISDEERSRSMHLLCGNRENMIRDFLIHLIWCLLVPSAVCAAGRVVPYPEKADLSGPEIAEQVFAVTHGRLVRNATSQRRGRDVAMVVKLGPQEGRAARRPSISTFEAYSNGQPRNPDIDSMQMTVIRSGPARGTGVLYIGYTNRSRASQLVIWLPSLHKARRITEPAHEDTWFGTNLTYGELVLRRPEDESHERLEDGTMQGCLPAMELKPEEVTPITRRLPGSQCGHRGKAVYRLRSTTRFKNWWYDYHVSEIDKETFAVYRTVYYKNDKKVKTVVMDWQSLGRKDPRIVYPRYIYALSHSDGTESMVFVPRSTLRLDQDLPDSFWSESTLKRFAKR